MRVLLRLLWLWSDAEAASRGPTALGRRCVRRGAHRSLNRGLRRWL